MSEEITFDPTGTVTVTFDDQTYKLGRPKMGQWRWFQRRLSEMADQTRERLAELTAEVEGAGDEARPELEEKLREYARTPFYESTIEWVREAFSQLGSQPLPADVDDWPAWLAADTSLPTQIITHWKTVPKASGSQNGS